MQGTECLVGLGLQREGATAALLIWKQGGCRYHQHLCPLLTHRHWVGKTDQKGFAMNWM